MLKIYTVYKCLRCKREIILINDDLLSALKENKYLSCPYCSSRKIKIEDEADSLKDIMKARSYRRVRGAIRERG